MMLAGEVETPTTTYPLAREVAKKQTTNNIGGIAEATDKCP